MAIGTSGLEGGGSSGAGGRGRGAGADGRLGGGVTETAVNQGGVLAGRLEVGGFGWVGGVGLPGQWPGPGGRSTSVWAARTQSGP